MLRIGSIFVSALALTMAVSSSVFAQSVDYRSFDAQVTLREDGSMVVKEAIDVIFYEEKHGIFRFVPVIYRDRFNNRLNLDLVVRDVRLDGGEVPFVVSKSGKDVEIKVGDPAITLDGEHIYEIQYEVMDAMRYFDTHDEIYWNITGSEWEAPIEKVSATVLYPSGVGSAKEAYCYTGDLGSTAQDCAKAETDGKIAFASEDFLTISLSFEKGIFIEPTAFERALELLKENMFAFLALIPVALASILWFAFGRDEAIGPIIAEFNPPDGVSAGVAGAIMRPFKGLDKHIVAGMVVELAVKGYLKIVVESEREKPKPKEIALVKQKPADQGLDEWQTRLFAMLFNGDEGQVTLDQVRFGASFEALGSDLRSRTVGKLYELSSRIFAIVTMVIGVAVGTAGSFLAIDYGLITVVAMFIGGISTVIIGIFTFKKSATGGELYRKVAGYKLFVQTAERYRAEWESKQNIFSTVLPYALAFKDVDHWAGLFKNVPLTNESWISATHGGVINAQFILGSLSTLQSGVSSAIPSSSLSSSGSGGGGFSGGGFGGGGGGSW